MHRYDVCIHASVTNLVTCGIWSGLISRNTFLGPQNAIIEINGSFFLDDEKGDLLEPFNQVGLNRYSVETLRYADIISSCFLSIYTAVHWNTFAGSVPIWCTRDVLFPFVVNTSIQAALTSEIGPETATVALGKCIDSVGSPRTLTPDIAGIGVRFKLCSFLEFR